MPSSNWNSPDLDEAKIARLHEIEAELIDLLPVTVAPRITKEEVANLTQDQAARIRIATRRMLMFQLLYQEYHWHEMDDCGDYLTAATDNWANLYGALFMNDFQDEISETQKFLLDYDAYPIGGCDGEIRQDILPDGWEDYDNPAS
jgi:hypothetical protein